MSNVVFVVPYVFETSVRFLRAVAGLPGVRVGLVSQDPLDRFGPEVRGLLSGHWQVRNALDPGCLVEGVRGVESQIGPVERLVGVLEQLQVPLARAREELGLPGLGVEAALNFRDKSRMKDVLREAGVPCARHRLVTAADEARAFLDEVGLPVVVKPPAGAGAVNTFRLDHPHQVGEALAAFPPSPQGPLLVEEFIVGEEFSFDSVCLGGEQVWHSISRYQPTPMDVLRNDWIQWCVLLPRDVSGGEYDAIREVAPKALAALGQVDGLSHMEWFRRKDGSIAVGEVGARPPGAQFTTLLGVAHDTDMYAAWARLMVGGGFDPPERRYAAGAAYLRGMGKGRVAAIHGLDRAQDEVGGLVVEVKLPSRGQPASSGYEGEGHVVVRHPDTEVVADALRRIVSTVRVELRQ